MKYDYSISTDFGGQAIHGRMFQDSIEASELATTVEYVGTKLDVCCVCFESELSAGDKTLLDGLVAAYDEDAYIPTRSPEKIMADIFAGATSQEQSMRLISALDVFPSFKIMLDQYRYDLARQRMGVGLSEGIITAEDYAIIDQCLPGYVAP